jgi:predicted nucleotidyltransferase
MGIEKKNELLELVKSHREEILSFAKKYGASNVRLFGSVVRGEEREVSDIDFVVDFEKKTFDSYMGYKIYLEDLLHRRVDLVMETAIKPELRESILKDAADVSKL